MTYRIFMFVCTFVSSYLSVSSQKLCEVVSKKLDVMSQPDANSKVIGLKVENDIIEVYSEIDGWACIKHEGGTGFVDQHCINTIDEDCSSKENYNQHIMSSNEKSRDYILQEGAEIYLQNTHEISAENVNVGQIVEFVISKNVNIDGIVIIPRGLKVKGVVYEVQSYKQLVKENPSIKKPKNMVHALDSGTLGKLGVRVDCIQLSSGEIITLKNGDIQGVIQRKLIMRHPNKKILEGAEFVVQVASTVTITK